MRATLRAEVAAFLREHGPSTASAVALGVRARRADVDVVLAGEGFSVAARPEGASPQGVYFDVSPLVPSRQGTVSQAARILAFLADGRSRTGREIEHATGCSRLNSRVSDLRRRGHTITCERRGGDYVYRLLDEAASRAAAGAASSSVPDDRLTRTPRTTPHEEPANITRDGGDGTLDSTTTARQAA